MDDEAMPLVHSGFVGFAPAPHPWLALIPRFLLWAMTPAGRTISWAMDLEYRWGYGEPIFREGKDGDA
jgi:hypothetical protein